MKLSIIIPFYQNERKLSSCLASLAKQTVFDDFAAEVEVIIINDGGEAQNYAEDYAELRGRVKNLIFYNISHVGAAGARNFGWQKTSGEFIFFCDADVIFLKNDALEKMIKVLSENPVVAFCYSSFKFGWKKFPGVEFDAVKLKKNNYISTMSLIRREWLQKISPDRPWDENLKRFQDWDLWLSLVEKGGKGIMLPEFLWQASGGTMSKWLPSFFYKIFKNNNRVKKYEEAKTIIMEKHNLK
jgi:glycosyltransferase involved in cell wall biosynthesis